MSTSLSDQIFRAGVKTSLSIGAGVLTYASLFNKQILTMHRPVKILTITSTCLGGAVCGGLIGGLSSVIAVGIGYGGRSPSERNAAMEKYGIYFTVCGSLFGGGVGLIFGKIASKITLMGMEYLSRNVRSTYLVPICGFITLSSIHDVFMFATSF